MRNLTLLFKQIVSEIRPKYSGNDGNGLQLLKQTVSDYSRNNLSPLEQESIRAIEAIRKELLNSTSAIPRIEHGAGSIVPPTTLGMESVRDICRTSSKPKATAMLLYHLIKHCKPDYAIELGACLGISGAYQAMALNHNKKGHLITIEGSPGRANYARSTFEKLSLTGIAEIKEGRFDQVLAEILPTIDSIDYIFIDGHHQHDATLAYFNRVLPYFKAGGVMVFDDIYWSAGMYKAWQAIKASRRVLADMEYKGMGILIV